MELLLFLEYRTLFQFYSISFYRSKYSSVPPPRPPESHHTVPSNFWLEYRRENNHGSENFGWPQGASVFARERQEDNTREEEDTEEPTMLAIQGDYTTTQAFETQWTTGYRGEEPDLCQGEEWEMMRGLVQTSKKDVLDSFLKVDFFEGQVYMSWEKERMGGKEPLRPKESSVPLIDSFFLLLSLQSFDSGLSVLLQNRIPSLTLGIVIIEDKTHDEHHRFATTTCTIACRCPSSCMSGHKRSGSTTSHRRTLSNASSKSGASGRETLQSSASSTNSATVYMKEDFSSTSFDANKYITEGFVGQTVERMKDVNKVLIQRRDEAANELKTNVYQNYPKFINASKEISNLEIEMLELRNMLTQNNSTMKGLSQYSVNITEAGAVPGRRRKMSDVSMHVKNDVIWLLQLPEKLDVAIALRQFEHAVSLIGQVAPLMERNVALEVLAATTLNLKNDVQQRIARLIEILLQDLSNGHIRSSESRNIIGLLLRLGMSDKAREVYLETRSRQIEKEIKDRKMQLEGDLTLYVSELARLVFSYLNTTCDDFRSSFTEPEMSSGFMVWAIVELEKFGTIFRNQVLNHSDDYATMGKCLEIAIMHCSLLESKGISLSFVLRQMFYPDLIDTMRSYHESVQNNLQNQIASEKWVSTKLAEPTKSQQKARFVMYRPGSREALDLISPKQTSPPANRPVKDRKNVIHGNKNAANGKKEEATPAPTPIHLTESCKYLYNASQAFVEGILHIVTLESDVTQLMDSLTPLFTSLFEKYMQQLQSVFSKKNVNLTDNQSIAILANNYNVAHELVPRLTANVEEKLGRNLGEFEKLTQNLTKMENNMQRTFTARKAEGIVRVQMDWYSKNKYSSDKIETSALPSAKFIGMIFDDVAERMNSADFWELVELREGGLQQLVLDVRFFIEAAGEFLSSSSKKTMNDIVDTAVLQYCKKADIELDQMEDAIKPDEWFASRVRSAMEKIIYNGSQRIARPKKNRDRLGIMVGRKRKGEEDNTSRKVSRRSNDDPDDEQDSPLMNGAINKKSDKQEALMGILEEIVLINFMCHKNLSLTFGPCANFVVGQNGSGKSAVLVGLTVGLGAKAGVTNRGSKITDLIRSGCNAATVSIRLRNRGTEAYRHDAYGDSITIERKIKKEGSSTYALKSASSKTVSKASTELHNILDHFNIQVSNPCSILMQDTSREFLNNATSKDKYKFFLMATQLDAMEKDFEIVGSNLSSMKDSLKRKRGILGDMNAKVEELREEMEQLNQLTKKEDHLQNLKDMMAWAHVQEQRQLVDTLETQVQNIQSNREKLASVLAKMDEQESQVNQEMTERSGQQKTLNERLKALKAELMTLQGSNSEAKREYDRARAEVSQCEKDIEMKVSRVKRMEKHLQSAQEIASRDKREERQKREAAIAEKEEKMENIKREMEQVKEQISTLEQEQSKFDEESDNFKRRENEVLKTKSRVDSEITSLRQQKEKGNNLNAYGPGIPELVKLLRDNRHKFKKPVIGPIGSELHLLNEQWGVVVEEVLKSIIGSFIVDNEVHDGKLFKEFCNRCRVQPRYIVSTIEDRQYDLRASELPDPRYTTVLSVLKANHPAVINTCIDQANIERNIMMKERKDASRVMFDNGPVPHHVKSCFTLDFKQLYVRNGTQVTVPWKGERRFLGVNVDSRLAECEAARDRISHEVRGMSGEKKKVEENVNGTRGQLQRARRQLQAQQQAVNPLQREIDELKNYKEPASEEQTSVEDLKQTLESLYKSLEEAKESKEKAQENAKEVKQKQAPFHRQLQEKQQEIDNIATDISSTQDNVNDVSARLQQLVLKKAKSSRAALEIERNREQVEESLGEARREVENRVAIASQICPEAIEREIRHVQDEINREKRGKRQPEVIRKRYKEANFNYQTIVNQVQSLEGQQKDMEKCLQGRLAKWQSFRKSLAMRTGMLFNYYLTQKGYSGSLKWDHEGKKLDIRVELDKDRPRQQQATQDTRALSGGERSYSTVSLLLALWEAMECPFRAMDEFDVFMDAMNRDLSIKLLIDASKEQLDRQFIFITPHDFSTVTGSHVRIHRMIPPERGQTTLNFSQSQSQA
ncbi:hypothetical protein PROFUN_11560 [Planoprotostelium fungivorum]|uniref:RecF/RecN/SMC N-terminal domain-containing protein n=1 Tax=Planoprotostelium fungivorum TaxID=1890364 RepID=A0A2P6N9I2_9EUKA|nr:hypothetical protein PROFUN_11560 [Planoprotostelium fungivorum]